MRRASEKGTGVDGLRAFRERLFGCLVRRADTLFGLCDAVLAASNAPSPAHLSLQAVHRRGWGSLYAALSKGGVDEGALRDLLARRSCASGGSTPPAYAVDVSPWPNAVGFREYPGHAFFVCSTTPVARRFEPRWRDGDRASRVEKIHPVPFPADNRYNYG